MSDSPQFEKAFVWFHRGLRVADHPALAHACKNYDTVKAIYCYSPEVFGDWMPGAARRWWLYEHLLQLGRKLGELGIELDISRNSLIDAILKDGGMPDAVLWNDPITPATRAAGQSLAMALDKRGIDHVAFAGDLLHNPDDIRTKKGDPYQVFTPFYKQFRSAVHPPSTVSTPETVGNAVAFSADGLASLELVPDHQWVNKLRSVWTPGEHAGHEQLTTFLNEMVSAYPDLRDRPDLSGTSRLSPWLSMGALSPRQCWSAAINRARAENSSGNDSFPAHSSGDSGLRSRPLENAPGIEAWLRQLAWREFSYHLLLNFPDTPIEPLRRQWVSFPWSMNEELFGRWKRGRTGFPIIDAGMRQLWQTGWMHNRVRMVVSSFLTKDLLIPWQEGARWFWDTLVDADLANNTLGWQWAAGCGADAQPFFRIFNPVSQGQKHDPQGSYVREWIPALRGVSDRDIHDPEKISHSDSGADYPAPLVDHSDARDHALQLYDQFRNE